MKLPHFPRLYDKTSTTETGCLLFTGYKTPGGYGLFSYKCRTIFAHRLSYMLAKKLESLPKDKVIRHMCGNRSCINPEHLKLGTHKENADDKIVDGTNGEGEQNSQSDVSKETAQKIIDSYGTGTQKERAERFGVKKHIVGSIDRFTSWFHLRSPEEQKIARQKNYQNWLRRKQRKLERRESTPYKVTKKFIDRHCQSKYVDPDTNCWLKGITKKKKYNSVCLGPYHSQLHRVIWEYTNNNGNKAPDDLVIRHLCHVKGCFNPAHLKIGTKSENAQDDIGRGGKQYKHTVEQVTLFKKLIKQGETKENACKISGVYSSCAVSIIKGKTWSSIKV